MESAKKIVLRPSTQKNSEKEKKFGVSNYSEEFWTALDAPHPLQTRTHFLFLFFEGFALVFNYLGHKSR